MENDEIFELSVTVGKLIIESGGEISRAEDTVKRINRAHGNDIEVFAIPSLIIAKSGNHTQVKEIGKEDTDLELLSRLNDLSRKLCVKSKTDININKKLIYPNYLDSLAVCIATASFCIYFGGKLLDAVFSALIGLTITYSNYKKIRFSLFSSNLIDSFIAGVLSFLPSQIGLNTHTDKIIIGTIMLLVPGLTIINAIRDMMSDDIIAGIFELINSIISALAIALGFGGAVIIFER